MSAERAAFQAEVEKVKKWWAEPRWRKTKRPYTAEQVVSKRGTLPIAYPAGVLGKKLYALLEERWAKREPSHTYGALDPVQVTQMAKYLETVYVSGWQSSSTASSSNEPGPDLTTPPTPSPTRSSTSSTPSSSTTGNSRKRAQISQKPSSQRLPSSTTSDPSSPMPIPDTVVSPPP
ncbi:isocitrate lyase family-domain-containing protein [Irpex lacteus]|nr:isocitrate lyase family-domain-containing protein [Irpex lacteus]